MIRRTDRVSPTLTKPEVPRNGLTQTPPAQMKPSLSSRPLSSQPSPVGKLKAVGSIFLIGALGAGTVLLIRGIRNLVGERTLRPIAEVTGGDQPPLRDRVQVIKPKPQAISPPTNSDLDSPNDRPLRRHQEQPSTARSSYGFGNGAPSISPDEEDIASSAEPEDDQADDQVVDAPDQNAQDAQDASGQAEPGQPHSPVPNVVKKTIAALLQPPQPIPTTAVATQPRSTSRTSIAVAPPPSRIPGLPRVPSTQPSPVTPIPTISPSQSPGTPTTSPPSTTATTPSGSQPVAPPLATTPIPNPQTATAINPSTATGEVYVGQLQITGSTQFSSRKLAETVQQAIATNTTNSLSETPATVMPVNNDEPIAINRTLTSSELLQASEAITKLYIDNGYINSGAYVPAEVLNGATPEIRVIEGRLETIKVDVTPADSLWLGQPLASSYVEQRLGAAIRSPLKLAQLLDAVKLLEQDPMISSISTELAPGTTIGGSILNVKVRQAPPFRSNLSVSNNRSPSVGQLEQQAGISQANLLGLGDSLQVSFRRTEGSSDWSINYSVPVTPQNGSLRLSYTNGSGEVIEEPFRVLDISSQSQNYEVAFRQPLIQTSTEEFALTLRATHYYNRGIFLAAFNDGSPLPFPAVGSDANGETRITALRFGQDWTRRSERDVISLQSEFSVGLNALGATSLLFPPDSQFISWQGQGFFVHSFAPDTLLAVRGKLQLADRPLVPSEQLSLGGVDTVRGYRPSTFLADNGWFASVEGYLPILRVPEWNGLLQVVPFFDVGQGWNNGDDQPTPNGLMSVGLGLQWKMGDNVRARLDWGVPLINAAPNGRSLEQNLFFSIIFSP